MWSLRPVRRAATKPASAPASRKAPPPPTSEPPAPARQEPVLEEVFVIGSNGLLIKHMSRTLMSEKDRDVVGGMISILSNFVREAFSEREGGDVQEITLGDHRFILCNEAGVVVAVLVTRGATEDIVPRLRHLIALLADRYGASLDNWGGEPLEGIEDEIAVLWKPFFLPPPPTD
jgi:predicted regulator of Ras-like GTPase activity (Roadblock/LC7/MglB family)